MLKRKITLALALAGEKAPTEIRVFGAGWNDTTKGMFLFDVEASVSVMKAATDWGNRYSFDYQHAVINTAVKPEDQKSAGSFLLELRGDKESPELWAVDIQWASGVAEAIEGKEWLYHSPLFMYDENSRRVLELINIALTNDPATKNMTPLLAASRLMALGMSHGQIRGAIQKALDVVLPETDGEWNYVADCYDTWFVFERGGKLWRLDYELAGSSVTLDGTPVEVRVTYEPVTQQQLTRPVAGHSPAPTQSLGRSTHMDLQALIVALGLKPNATVEEVMAALQNNRSVLMSLMTLSGSASAADAMAQVSAAFDAQRKLIAETGAQSVSAALGMVAGWKTSAEALTAAQARIVELEKAEKAQRVDKAIAKGKSEHRVTPGMEASLRAKGLEDPEWLEGHIPTLPVVAALAGNTYREPPAGGPTATAVDLGGKKWEELKFQQRADLARKNPQLYQALKADFEARNPA